MRRLPLFPSHTPAAIHAHAREAFREVLNGPRSARGAAEIGTLVGAWAEEATDAARAESGEPALACSQGCSSCCYLKVAVTAPEAIALAMQVRQLPDDVRTRAVERVIAADAETRGMTTTQRLKSGVPCPLLDEEQRCVAYDARPAACRAANSYDREGCARALATPNEPMVVPSSAVAKSMCDATRGAASATAMEAGLDGRLLELIAALRIALERPEAADEWARGRPAFRFAVDAEIEAVLRAKRRR